MRAHTPLCTTATVVAVVFVTMSTARSAPPLFEASWRGFDTGDWPTFAPNSIALGDLDADGDLDAVVGREMFSGPGISVLFQNDDGTFAQEVIYELDFMQSVGDVALADIDLDNDLDAIATVPDGNGQTNAFVVWRNDGTGTFGEREPFAAGPGPAGLVVADFDGDTFPDVMTADLGYIAGPNETISLMKHNGLAGPAAGFLAPISFTVGDDCTQIAAADLDGDLDLDVAVGRGDYANYNDHGISVLFNDGTGNFGPPTTYEQMPGAYRYSTGVALADLDNDNDIDMIGAAATNDFTSYGYVCIRRNDGAGIFGPPELYQLEAWTFTPRGLNVAHLNDDGYLDILATTPSGRAMDGFSILLSDGGGGFQPARYEASKQTWDITTYDKDDDGDLDVISVANDASVLTVHENLGDGTLFVAPRYDTTNGWFSDAIAAADFDGDQDIDIVSSDYTIRIFRNNGDGTFPPVEEYNAPFDPGDIKLVDLNQDTYPDLLIGPDPCCPPFNVAVALADQEGGFLPADTIFTFACTAGQIDTFDLDNDNDQDIVLTDLGCDIIHLVRNNGTSFTVMTPLDTPGRPWRIGGADFDHDGHMDLVSSTVLGLGVFPGNGDFTFRNPLLASEWAYDLVVTDFDLDGNADLGIMGGESSFGTVSLATLRGYGDGTFAFAEYFPGPNGRESAFRVTQEIITGDVDSDGLPDLATTNNAPNDISVFLGNGDGTMQLQDRYGAGYSPRRSVIADLNGDDVMDLATLVGSAPSGFNEWLVVLLGDTGSTVQTVRPDSFNTVFGRYVQGGVQDLFDSDNSYVVIEQRPAFSPLLPLIRLEVDGTAAIPSATQMVVTIETASTALPSLPPQKLSLHDFAGNVWEIVDDRIATSVDSVIEVSISANASRFIESGTNAMQMRIDWFDPGNVFLPAWVTRTDLATWTLTP